MMDDLKRMVIYSHVVEAGSFSGAARRMGIAKSAVSKHVSLLEQSLGVRLLNRNTRSLSMTDVGESYYQSCAKLVEVVEQAKQCISGIQDEPRGTLRVSSPASFGFEYVAPLLNEYLQDYPSLNAELLLDDNVVDMTEQGIDVAIRVGWLTDSNLRAKKLKDAPRLLCASPGYLDRSGTPLVPKDIAQHQCVIFTLLPTPYQYKFTKNNKCQTVQIKGRLKTNNGNAVRALAREGAGIAVLSDFLISEDIEKGDLIHLLPEYHIEDVGIYAVYQDQHLQHPKIRTFIDFLAKRL